MLSVKIKTVGNPDRGQYAPITSPAEFSAETLSELLSKIREYQVSEMIGGGNWIDPVLLRDGVMIGVISYNGRVWDKDGREIVS